MKKSLHKIKKYDSNLHNILIQTTNLSLYEQVTKKEIIQVLRVRKLPRSFFELKMNRIKSIDPIVAKQLEYSHFDTIELKGVKKIDNKALTYLANSRSLLDLGITSLNITQANIIVKHHKAALVFSNLKSITLPIAKVLANYKGNILDLCAITKINSDCINYLFDNYVGDFLTIGNLAIKNKHSK